jgi:LuxR family maltose regulon positive regulatory protein
MKARLHIAEGDLTTAAGWAHDSGVTVDDGPDYLREYEHLTLARLLLAQHRAAQHRAAQHSGHPGTASPVAAALGLLDRLHAAAADAGRDGSLLEIRVLQALAHHAHGDRPRAMATLSHALVEAPEPDSYVRLYLDEGDPMLALLRNAADPAGEHAVSDRDGYEGAVQGPARRLLQRAKSPVPAPQQLLADPLSQRELQVLRLLDSELTGPQIARELYVSLNTLRTHTKSIFTKLDVNTRAAAVRRAHGLGFV